MMNVSDRKSCHELFINWNILPLHSQYIVSLSLFVVKNIDKFKSNFEVHSINTLHRFDLFPPTAKLSKFQKGVYYSGIKIFNRLPQSIKCLSGNVKKFKGALKKLLLCGSFYTLNKYLDWNSTSDLGTLP
jgi:hypothetical protein